MRTQRQNLMLLNSQPTMLPAFIACLLLPVLLLLLGCQPSQRNLDRHPTNTVPPDLSIELFIDGDPQSTEPLTHQSRYVLEPDGSLHIAVNRQAKVRTYPPFIKFLTRTQMQSFSDLIQTHNLMHARSSETGDSSKRAESAADKKIVRYQLSLSAWGKTNHLTSTLDGTPGLRALVKQFIEAGEVQPSGQIKPPPPAYLFHSPSSVESP